MQSFDFEIGTNCGVSLRLAFTVSLNDHVEHRRSQNQLASAVTFEARNIAQSRSSKSRHNRLMDRGLVWQSLQFEKGGGGQWESGTMHARRARESAMD